jgi:hypothetical protein
MVPVVLTNCRRENFERACMSRFFFLCNFSILLYLTQKQEASRYRIITG